MEDASASSTAQYDVSVVVPVYNVEKYLPQCIDSVINQTYKNLQIILVDDGSTDSSGKICDDYSRTDPRISVIHKPNGGLSDARNAGLAKADSKYVYFLDSDDYIEPQAIETLYDVSEQNNLDVVCFDAYRFFEEGFSYQALPGRFQMSRAYDGVWKGHELFMEFIINRDYNTSVPFHFFRRQFLSDTGLSFYKGILHEDHLFIFAAMLQARRAMHIPLPLYNRRFRAESIMTTKVTQRNSDGMYIVMREMLGTYRYLRDDPEKRAAYDTGICETARIYAALYVWAYSVQNEKGHEQYREIMGRLKSLGYDTSWCERRVRMRYLFRIRSAIAKIPGLKPLFWLIKRTVHRIKQRLTRRA